MLDARLSTREVIGAINSDCSISVARGACILVYCICLLRSIYGYDYILLDVRITEADTIILQNLCEYFQRHVSRHYPKVSWRDVQLIAASLYVSLIPLHSDFSHQLKF